MDKFLIVVGAVGIVCALAALVGIGITASSRGHWGVALGCVAGFAVIVGLTLFGIEYSQSFWEGK